MQISDVTSFAVLTQQTSEHRLKVFNKVEKNTDNEEITKLIHIHEVYYLQSTDQLLVVLFWCRLVIDHPYS